MIRLSFVLFKEGITCREVANRAAIRPETLCRIMNGKQSAGLGDNQSATRIARAVGWRGSPEELFEEIDPANLVELAKEDD